MHYAWKDPKTIPKVHSVDLIYIVYCTKPSISHGMMSVLFNNTFEYILHFANAFCSICVF